MRRVPFVAAAAALPLSLGLLFAPVATAAAAGNSAAAQQCEDGGYVNYQRTDGSRFANEGACTSYAARGGGLVPIPTRSIDLVFAPSTRFPGLCDVFAELQGFAANTFYLASYDLYQDGEFVDGQGAPVTTDASGSANHFLFGSIEGVTIKLYIDGASVTEVVDC